MITVSNKEQRVSSSLVFHFIFLWSWLWLVRNRKNVIPLLSTHLISFSSLYICSHRTRESLDSCCCRLSSLSRNFLLWIFHLGNLITKRFWIFKCSVSARQLVYQAVFKKLKIEVILWRVWMINTRLYIIMLSEIHRRMIKSVQRFLIHIIHLYLI